MRIRLWRALGLLLLVGLWHLWAPAQTLESVLSPGPLVRSHAKVDGDCTQCHVRFDRAGQDTLCTACHKEVASDLRLKTGLHGRHKPATCRSCHTDHRGRDMQIAPLDKKAFDHRKTDYLLRDKHTGVDCGKCHTSGKKYRDAPMECNACHRKDDKHKGSLGTKCADCHNEKDWKDTSFDHDTTRYPLTGKHVEVGCKDCHRSSDYKDAPTTCIGCHKKDDKHKARYGEKCESCHGTRNWTGISFRHDTDTKFALRGKHRDTRCDGCHGNSFVYRDKPGNTCIDCHKKDDKHQGTLGSECASCHTERNWKETARFDHDRSSFPLRGAHVKPACKDCHTSVRYKDTPSDCLSCHKKDDQHEGTLGTACGDCHTDRDWKASRFDHARTRFALRSGHAVPPLQCSDCHRDLKTYRKSPLDCIGCHKKDDKHEGQLGTRCDSCHGERNWTSTRFDHTSARFALTGAHVRVECKSCHRSARYRDAARDCIGCHQKDDKHKARFGEDCASCHNARDWRLWTFDHLRRADYRLDEGHAKVACEACHVKPAPRGKAAAPLERTCMACHRRDDVHDGAFGLRCEQCHTPTNWKRVSNRQRLSQNPTRPQATHPALAGTAWSRS